MSILFGIQATDRKSVELGYLSKLAQATERFAPDGTSFKNNGSVGMGFQPYHTHERSRIDTQPISDRRRNMLTFDGRLDNHKHLTQQLGLPADSTPDSMIVLAAYDRWAAGCFVHLIGDWSLALWSEWDQSLYLARDHAGTRNLYYEATKNRILWGTYLDTFFADGESRELDQTFAACFLAGQPIRDATPYKGIRAVTPAHFIKFQGDRISHQQYWSPMAIGQIHYREDSEYEEHFLSLLKQSVSRRTVPGAPILAELSGGMDSTSIICVSDHMRRQQGNGSDDLLDTISYYDDTEPNWNEKPFFTAVEKLRGKQGIHIDTSRQEANDDPPDPTYLWPGSDGLSLLREQNFEEKINQKGYRSILSGIGGDELLGGPPNPFPELADYAVRGHFATMFRQAFAWSLHLRTPMIHTLGGVVGFARDLYPSMSLRPKKLPPWIPDEAREQFASVNPSEFRHYTIGLLPSSVDNGVTWWNMLETLPHRHARALVRREYRYPYLDRDLVDYLLRIPPNQLLKPGRRRYMMRNALRGLVPAEIVERKRKAFVSRGPIVQFTRDLDRILEIFSSPEIQCTKLIRINSIQTSLRNNTSETITSWLAPLARAVQLEVWLSSSSHLISATA